jgi:hypothetical protein
LFFYFVWRRIARYGFDGTQRSEARRWTFYLLDATTRTYEVGHPDMLHMRAKRHLRSIVDCDIERRDGLVRNDTMKDRVMRLEVKCNSTDLVARGFAKMKMHLKDPVLLRQCGGLRPPSPRSFHLEMERDGS